MKKMMIAVFVFALSLGMFASQASSTSATKPSGKMAKSSKVTGCLEGSSGNYMVKSGKKETAVTSSQDLAGDVGHKVKLTGPGKRAPGSTRLRPSTPPR
jgi:hypothetical protein